jgi:hypothetical protein
MCLGVTNIPAREARNQSQNGDRENPTALYEINLALEAMMKDHPQP